MKKVIIRAVALITCVVLLLLAIPYVGKSMVPEYIDSIGDQSDQQKIQGMYLLDKSANRADNVIIYGSSELRTDYISTHPANFFRDKRTGFQVNLVGRGSCQSIIHAMSIGASGDSLKNSKVVLITSPQSYVKDGITPDMFMANFSKQQYTSIMLDSTVSSDIKQRLSKRVLEMMKRYDTEIKTPLTGYQNIKTLAQLGRDSNILSKAGLYASYPYYALNRYMYDVKDLFNSGKLILNHPEKQAVIAPRDEKIDWAQEAAAAVKVAKSETSNNQFGMYNDYYNTYIGRKLARMKDKDKELSYSESVEYDDLRLLLDICKEKGIRPMFVSVPLHAQWSDYVGFTSQKRQEYYQKVNSIVRQYDVTLLDLSGYEDQQYFLCDTMHLGWKGWLKVDEEIDRFYHNGSK